MAAAGYRLWACFLLLGVTFAAADGRKTTAVAPETLSVGRLTLHHCDTPAPWCGTLVRALDPSGAVPGSVPVYFEYYPHSASGPAAGTLVANEGGPGYPTTESRDEYLVLFEPLRTRYDVLLMDYRGTGRSGAVDCHQLQQARVLTEANIGGCGRSLGARVSLYSTALAADDLAALLAALGVERATLYGESYGTYFTQVFTLRHPDAVRAVVLDGAYQLDGGAELPWYPHYATAMRDKFNRACERSAECSAIAGTSLEHIAPALKLLREKSFEAHVREGEGRMLNFTANATQLAIVMFGASPPYASLRELDAAARAFSAGDRPPLLRLMAETLASVDSRDATRNPRLFSEGLAAAVSCGDPPQIFDMTLPPPQRARARDLIIANRKAEAPDTYAPFTLDEYRGMPLDYEFIDQCVQWPARTPAWPSSALVPDAPYPDVPVLVVSGEFDNMTSVATGAAAAARFPAAHHVVISNGLHINALQYSRSACGMLLVRRFLENLSTEDDRCAAQAPPVRLVPRFARYASQLAPAQALSGNQADEEALRYVSAALLSAEDVIARARDNGAGEGVGLRGGTFAVTGDAAAYHLKLHDVRWSEDLAVSGDIDWAGGSLAHDDLQSGWVRADLELTAPHAVHGRLEMQWPEGVAKARATVRGNFGAQAVLAEAPAP
jgi:pimeloyl-ACP methyl ester carboxylesterase